MLRKLLTALIISLCVVSGGLLGLGLLMVSTEPMIPTQSFSADAYQRTDQWLSHIRDAFEEDKLNRITLTSEDISDLAFYAAGRLKMGRKRLFTLRGIKTQFAGDTVMVRFTLKPNMDYPLFLNISVSLSEEERLPRWDFLEVGSAHWPGSLVGGFVQQLLMPQLPESKVNFWRSITGAVEKFSIFPDRVALSYRTDEALRSQLKSQATALILSSPEEQQALQLYIDVLAASVALQNDTEIALSKVMVTLFGLAKARSDQGSAVEENSRLLRAMAVQVADPSVRVLLAPGVQVMALDRPIVLRGRGDLTQHFLISAALALALDEDTALNIGVSKEQSDAKEGGSGFSLSDLLADMAGIRFAASATKSEDAARQLQAIMLSQHGEGTFMPRIEGLPLGLAAQDYESLARHPMYPAMLDTIVDRLNKLPVHTGTHGEM